MNVFLVVEHLGYELGGRDRTEEVSLRFAGKIEQTFWPVYESHLPVPHHADW
jgi:hypothetical protein